MACNKNITQTPSWFGWQLSWHRGTDGDNITQHCITSIHCQVIQPEVWPLPYRISSYLFRNSNMPTENSLVSSLSCEMSLINRLLLLVDVPLQQLLILWERRNAAYQQLMSAGFSPTQPERCRRWADHSSSGACANSSYLNSSAVAEAIPHPPKKKHSLGRVAQS